VCTLELLGQVKLDSVVTNKISDDKGTTIQLAELARRTSSLGQVLEAITVYKHFVTNGVGVGLRLELLSSSLLVLSRSEAVTSVSNVGTNEVNKLLGS
jgi:hypothetical protein